MGGIKLNRYNLVSLFWTASIRNLPKKYIVMLYGVAGFVLALPVIFTNFADDAYIHARVVDMLVSGNGLSYNVGDTYKVDSSTGFVFLVAFFTFFLKNSILAVRFVEFLTVFFTVQIFGLVANVCSMTWRQIIVGICCLPYFLLAAYLGMDTPVVCFLVLLVVLADYLEKYKLAIFLLSCAVVFRFEVILLFFLVMVFYFASQRIKKYTAIFAFPCLLVLAMEFVFLGGVIPHGAAIKFKVYNFSFFNSFNNAISFSYGQIGSFVGIIFLYYIVLNFKYIITLPGSIKQIADILFIWSACIFVAWLSSRSLIFEWYYCLVVSPFGIYSMFKAKLPKNDENNFFQILEFFIMFSFCLLGLREIDRHFAVKNNPVNRVAKYLSIGANLYALCPHCSLATSETGALGYSFKGKIYDGFGLGDPEAINFHPLKVPTERQHHSIGAIPPLYIAYRDPDFIVTMPTFAKALLNSDIIKLYNGYDCFFSNDEGLVWGNAKIEIYSKQKIPPMTVQNMECKSQKGE